MRLKPFAGLLITGIILLVPAMAEERPSIRDQIIERERAGMSEAHRQSQAKRLAATGANRRNSSQYLYRDANGTPTLTNRPQKYDSNTQYERIEIAYTPITVPQKYRGLSSAEKYSSTNIGALVRQYSAAWGLDENLVLAVIHCESAFDADAVSPAGACGLMQLMPGTAADMGVQNIFDPAENIAGGTQYLAKMLELFRDTSLALAAYNAGPENVKKYGGIPPFQETQTYVRKVLEEYQRNSKGGSIRRDTLLASARGTGKRRPLPPPPTPEANRFMVHFHSGLTQPADKVTDMDPYYYIEYRQRTYPVRKDLVAKIEKPA